MERREALVRRFQRAKIGGVESQDYEVLFGRGRFAQGGGVDVDGRRLTADVYVIATGSVPASIPIPGLESVPVITSDDVMQLESQPRSPIVQGAGPIGLELAQAAIQCHLRTCNTLHSHSIVNEPFLRFTINGLLVGVGVNTMKNTMFRNFFKKFEFLGRATKPAQLKIRLVK